MVRKMDWNILLASTRGRLHLKPFWITTAAVYGLSSVIFFASYYAAARYRVFYFQEFLMIVNAVVSIQFFLMCAPIIKRLHDLDRSGWWLLPMWVLPQGYFILGRLLLPPLEARFAGIGSISAVVVFVILVWAFLALFVLRGTAGANHYGPDPRPVRLVPRFWKFDFNAPIALPALAQPALHSAA